MEEAKAVVVGRMGSSGGGGARAERRRIQSMRSEGGGAINMADLWEAGAVRQLRRTREAKGFCQSRRTG